MQRSAEAGAQLVTGGHMIPVAGEGGFYRPTIWMDVDGAMEAVRDEIFGPVLTVQVFDSEEQAIQLAGHETYGLAAGVHTADIGHALRCVRQIEAGTIWINRYGRTEDFVIPTGGFKGSGIGKDPGRQAYDANRRVKNVLIDFAQGS